LNQGEKPSVLSAILKYHNTEGARQVLNDAMDVHGGRAVCDGPGNYLQNLYRAVPVAITVEGANILTRSMIIFGQGAMRCHPYVLKEMRATATISNAVRTVLLGLTGARFTSAPDVEDVGYYYRQLTRMSAAFAFGADVGMLTLGGELKRKERLSARYGDVLSHLYMASAVLKRHHDNGSPKADLPFVKWALEDSLHTMQASLMSISENFPSSIIGRVLRAIVFPLGRPYNANNDQLDHQVARLLMAPSESRDRLTAGSFVNRDQNDPVGLLEISLGVAEQVAPIKVAVAKSTRWPFAGAAGDAAIAAAIDSGDVNELDGAKLREHLKLIADVIRVDEFPANSNGVPDRRYVAQDSPGGVA